MAKATSLEVDTLYMETCAAYGRSGTDAEGKVWLDVLANTFTEAELRNALIEHQADNSRDYKGNIRGEQMPTPARIKDRIETIRSSREKVRFYCGDPDCFGLWRDDHTQKRRVHRCSKCEALRDSQVHPVTGETYAEHIKTSGYLKAKTDLLAALKRWGGMVTLPGALPEGPE